MVAIDSTLIILLFILAIGLILPEVFKKTRLPFITLIILAGAITGPNGFDYFQIDTTLYFLGFLGMAFLMLMAGLETDIRNIAKAKDKIAKMAALNMFVPFLVGVAITKYFGYSWMTSLLVGVIFISSSVAIIIPSIKEGKLLKKKTTELIFSTVMFADIISLIALGFILQKVAPITSLPLHVYIVVLILSLAFMFFILPKISKFIFKRGFSEDRGKERKVRYVIIVLIAVLAYFSLLGVHPILAAFLAGMFLAGSIRNDRNHTVYKKLHVLGYGIFVPVFFFIIGMELDLRLLGNFDLQNIIMISLILGLMISKFVSGYIGGKLAKLNSKESKIFGSISMTQLTTTLAVTYAAADLGILDSTLTTTIIILSLITTFVGPILASYIGKKKD